GDAVHLTPPLSSSESSCRCILVAAAYCTSQAAAAFVRSMLVERIFASVSSSSGRCCTGQAPAAFSGWNRSDRFSPGEESIGARQRRPLASVQGILQCDPANVCEESFSYLPCLVSRRLGDGGG